MSRTLLAVLLIVLAGSVAAAALQVPAPEAYVQDRAELLGPETERKLEAALQQLDEAESTQIAVLTIPSLEGESLEEYALAVAERWGIGSRQQDNGALLLIARNERRIRIEVGYGLEHLLTDLVTGRIIDHEITPHFRQGDFDGGVIAGVQAMVKAVHGAYQGQGETTERRRSPWGLLALLLFLGPGLLRISLGGSRRRGYRRGGIFIGGLGGGFGGGRGGGFGGFGGGGFGGGGASGRW